MKVNLSLVLDEYCEVRLDLMKNIDLQEVDKYTTSKFDNKDIREDYKEEINKFLNENKTFTDTFRRESNKKGNIVITLNDENNKMRRLRVLYKKNINKLDTDLLTKRVIATLKSIKDINKTRQLIGKYNHLIFNSPVDYKTIKEADYKYNNILNMHNDDLKNKKINNVNNSLILMIKNRFLSYFNNNSSKKQNDIGYYYLRLVDAYIEKNFKVFTTKDIVNTKLGQFKINVNEIAKNKNVKLEKEDSSFNGQKITVEDDGQFSIFNDEDEYKEVRMRLSDLDYEHNYYDGEEITKHGKY